MERNSAGRFQSGRSTRPAAGRASQSGHWGTATGVGALIGGAVLGTVAMYLLDPEEGERRRAAAREMARKAFERSTHAASAAYAGTAHLVGDAVEAAREKADEYGSAAVDAMPNGKHLRNGASHLLDEAREMPAHVRDYVASWIDKARGYMPKHGLRMERHSDYAMGPVGVSATALSTMVVGAAAMWIMDPRLGRARRAWIGQKVGRAFREVGEMARTTGRHLRDKAQGCMHDTADAVSHAASSAKDAVMGARRSSEERVAQESTS